MARTTTSRSRARSGRAATPPRGHARRARRTPAHDERQASIHRRTRQAHSSEIAEDYVEVIGDLIDTQGEARAIDIARRLGVTHVTVTKTVGRLQRAGLVTSRPYRSIFL